MHQRQFVSILSGKKSLLGLCFLSLLLNPVSCFGQISPIISKHRILVYGEPSHEGELNENLVGRKWGIEFYRVAGCAVTRELGDSVRRHNDSIETILMLKHGLDWRRRFDEDLKAEHEKQNQIIEHIKQLEYIEVKQSEMEKKGGYLYYLITPVLNSSKYKIIVAGWIDATGTYLGHVYDLELDYPGMAVTILD